MGYKIIRAAVIYRRFVVLLFATIIFSTIYLLGQSVNAENHRVVTIHFDGFKRTISTEANTVGEVLEQTGVSYIDEDLVEPSLDTQIISSVFNINVYRARPVTIVDGDKRLHIMSAYQSPRLIAEEAGLKVYDEDAFTLERIDNFLEFGAIGQKLTIDRAAKVNMDVYGTKMTYRTQAETVGQVLEEKGISLEESDTLSPSADTAITHSDSIKITRVGHEMEAVKKPIAYSTEVIYDSNSLEGSRTVKQAGKNGEKIVTFKVKLHNDKPVKREKVQEVISKQPVNEIVVVGTKPLYSGDPSGNVAIGQRQAAARGWTGNQWTCLYLLWQRESNWNHTASNSYSGAYGIPQALPGSKMSSHGGDWQSNPATQIAWGLDYIAGRYGSPCGAWEHSENHNWY